MKMFDLICSFPISLSSWVEAHVFYNGRFFYFLFPPPSFFATVCASIHSCR
eukprot:m.56582 g.56582  ORF g.56582 m.56582 type:complete len:51 (-) comp7804_c0_seq1:2782-2934(-)